MLYPLSGKIIAAACLLLDLCVLTLKNHRQFESLDVRRRVLVAHNVLGFHVEAEVHLDALLVRAVQVGVGAHGVLSFNSVRLEGLSANSINVTLDSVFGYAMAQPIDL